MPRDMANYKAGINEIPSTLRLNRQKEQEVKRTIVGYRPDTAIDRLNAVNRSGSCELRTTPEGNIDGETGALIGKTNQCG